MVRPIVDIVIRAPKGTARRIVPLGQVRVPDLRHVIEYLKRHGHEEAANEVLTCWHLTHDLLANLKGDV